MNGTGRAALGTSPQSWVSSAKGSITIFRQESIRGIPQGTGVEQPQVLRDAALPWKR